MSGASDKLPSTIGVTPPHHVSEKTPRPVTYVRLSDVVGALRGAALGRANEVTSPLHAADFIEREFGRGTDNE